MTDTDKLNVIAKRISVEMLGCIQHKLGSQVFLGLGVALAIVYESITGRSAKERKPQELVEWASNLPNPKSSTILTQ